MRRILELHKLPERRAADAPLNEVLDEVPDGVIRHRALNDVIRMRSAAATGHDEIKPLVGHLLECLDREPAEIPASIRTNEMPISFANRPTPRLLLKSRAVEPVTEILGKAIRPDFRLRNGCKTAMKYYVLTHADIIPKYGGSLGENLQQIVLSRRRATSVFQPVIDGQRLRAFANINEFNGAVFAQTPQFPRN